MLSTFEVIAEPTRRKILDLLRSEERSVTDLVTALGLAQPAVSKHLKVLRDAGLVTSEVAAQRRLYHLSPGPLRELDQWVAPYRRHWNDHLDALEQHLATMPNTPTENAKEFPPPPKPSRSKR